MIFKIIKLEWVKFVESRKNRLIFILLFLFLTGIVFYNQIEYKNYFEIQEKSMIDQRNKAKGALRYISVIKENNKEYKENPNEILYLKNEEKNSLTLEYYYKDFKIEDSINMLKAKNKKFENLIFGQKNGFIKAEILKARGQIPISLMRYIAQNNYIIDNEIEPKINPYDLNGANFLLILLKGYTPIILVIFTVLLSMDIFSSEMEEGSYKVYYTQPISRGTIYWAKILSGLLFSLGTLIVLISSFFAIISMMNGIGEYYYPEAIASSKILLSFTNNIHNLGAFMIVSRAKLIILGYLLMFIVSLSSIVLAVFISIISKSSAKTLGVFASILLGNFVMNLFLKATSLVMFYFPLSYTNIEKVIYGEINSSYIFGITMSILIIALFSIIGERIISKSDLLGGEI
ncbi:ABC transporter permease [Fusibacter bizertensis]